MNPENGSELMKLIYKVSKLLVDILITLTIVPGAYLLLFYRRIGSKRLPLTTSLLRAIGIFPIRKHYYEPFFDKGSLENEWEKDRFLPGINLNIKGQLDLLAELKYSDELIGFDLDKKPISKTSFSMRNNSFKSGDAEFLYQMIRFIKPRKVIEIGCGNSTKIIRLAIEGNNSKDGIACSHTCIEPFEQPWLESLEGVNVARSIVENYDFDWGEGLEEGDFLFIDSSHVIRPHGDILKIYLEILPLLRPGVFVHIHDIFTPKNYLKSWMDDDIRFWNEQYLLEAMLTNTKRYQIIAALNFLKTHYYNELRTVCPYLTSDRDPGSFYLKIVE